LAREILIANETIVILKMSLNNLENKLRSGIFGAGNLIFINESYDN
jgi:hypothetical protein